MSLEDLRQSHLYLTERVAKLEAAVLTLKNTVDAMSAILYHREPPSDVTKENVLEGLNAELKSLVEIGEFEGEIRVCMKQYIPDRSKWNTLNKFLREKGLKWHSLKKDSYWGNR